MGGAPASTPRVVAARPADAAWRPHPTGRRRALPARGLTLVELVIALAVLAVLATLALPSFGSLLNRHRLQAAAETLALDLAEARHEAARAGTPLHVVFRPGAQWCWAVARTPDCDCTAPTAGCALKTVTTQELPGVTLATSGDASFGGALPATPNETVLRSQGGTEALQVRLSPLGRASICSPTGMRGYARC